ncbi:hypothetical protein R2R70_16940 [Cobetia sp. SIMBA_158]
MAGENRQQGESKADEQQKKKEQEKGEKAGKKIEAQRRLNACLNIGIGELFCSLIKGMILTLLAS